MERTIGFEPTIEGLYKTLAGCFIVASMHKPGARVLAGAAAVILATLSLTLMASTQPARADATTSIVNPTDALKQLLEGNQRFVAGQPQHANQEAARRPALVAGQHPFAAILSCSDSRVPPEIVFDRGLGDLFIVRDAGNVTGPLALESLHYAIAHLGTKLVVVLGHTSCGAVAATVSGKTGDIPESARAIEPAVENSKSMPGDPLENAIIENVRLTVEKLSTWKPLASMIKRGELRIVGAVYHLDSGRVILIDAEGRKPH